MAKVTGLRWVRSRGRGGPGFVRPFVSPFPMAVLLAAGLSLLMPACRGVDQVGEGDGSVPGAETGRPAGAEGATEGAAAPVDALAFCAPLLERMDAFTAEKAAQAGRRGGGGTVVAGAPVEIPKGMNSLVGNTYAEGQHQIFVTHTTLVRLDEDLRPEPYLARSWEVAEDGSMVTFHLRDDVYWHDGVRTTAEDVAFTYRMATDPEGAFPFAGFWTRYVPGEAGVEVVDSFTVRIRMAPQQDFLDPWRATAIMPEHILGDVGWDQMVQHPYGTDCPVGNGPFRFVEHDVGGRWVFEANPAFPEELGGPPEIDRYVYRVIPDAGTRLAELATGGIQVNVSVPWDRLDEVQANPRLEPIIFPTRNFTFLGWNGRNPLFSDPAVRRALTMALDRGVLLETAAGGYGTIINTPVPPYHPGFDVQASRALSFDAEGARRMLREAGFQDRDGDGVLEGPDGEPFRFDILVQSDNRERLDLAELAALSFREMGIEARVETLEYSTFVQRITDPERPFDAFVVAWVPEFKLDDRDQFHSDRQDGAFAFSGITDPRLDDVMDALSLEMDPLRADSLLGVYQALMVELQPYTFFYAPERIAARSRDLVGVVMDVRGEWASVRDWRYQASPGTSGEGG